MRKDASGPRFLLLLSFATISLLCSCSNFSGLIPGPRSNAGEPAQHLAVSDLINNRILIFDAPFTTDEAASVVLGQPNFTLSFPNQDPSFWQSGGIVQAAANTLYWPSGLAMDLSGNLWVADQGNCRVLEFTPPFTSGMSSSLVLGHPDFTSARYTSFCEVLNATSMLDPVSVAFDSHGDLWVADAQASRVTEYVPPFTNGMAAVITIGEPSLNVGYQCNGEDDMIGRGNDAYPPPPTAASLCGPSAITFDSRGDLWVADRGNSRVLMFRPPFSTGMAASLELGQPAATAFTSYHCGDTSPESICQLCDTSATTLCFPQGITFDSSGKLWVADTGNSRVLEYVPPFLNDMAASLVVGEPDFTSGRTQTDYFPPFTPDASALYGPSELSFDGRGNLAVADIYDCRVLVFIPPFRNGMDASAAIGRRSMNSGCPGGFPSANALGGEFGELGSGGMGAVTF